MALPKLYDRTIWHNNTTPAINEDNLNAMSKGLDDVDDRLIDLAGTIMEDVPQIIEDMEILEPAIENIDSNVARAETAADNAEDSALKSEGYAIGEQDGVEVGPDSEYYQKNAKYYADIANPPIENTVDFTDAITISDAINKAAKDVKLKVEAVQDLHGYNNPWVGGAGKNKCPLTIDGIKAVNTGGTWNGNVYTYETVVFTLQTDSDGNIIGIKATGANNTNDTLSLVIPKTAPLTGNYFISGCPSNGSGSSYNIRIGKGDSSSYVGNDTGNGVAITATGEAWDLRLHISRQYTIPTSGLFFYPQIESGSAKTAFEPYTNICPITGWSQIQLARMGKNILMPGEGLPREVNGITYSLNADGSYHVKGTATAQSRWYFTPNGQSNIPWTNAYYNCAEPLVVSLYGEQSKVDIWCDTTGIGTIGPHGTAMAKTVPAHSNFGNFFMFVGQGVQVDDDIYPMVCPQSLANEIYEPYQGEEITISLNGTRYGGTLDVTSGVLTLTRGYKDLSTLTWTMLGSAGSQYFISSAISDFKHVNSDVKANMICSCFEVVSQSNRMTNRAGTICEFSSDNPSNPSRSLLITSNLYGDANALTAALNGQTLVYELATPTTVQLTATEVYLLYGYNTLYGNCGDISLTYDASGIIHIDEAKLDTETLKTIAAASSDFADFKARIAAL